jgi:hypothetical protein
MNLTDLHKRMVRNIFLNVELLLNDDVDDLSEYDVQGLMFFYLRRALLNTTATAERERKGKVDCVVYDNGDPVLLYEMKTYYKKHEKLRSEDFDHDLTKLFDLLAKYSHARAYFLLAGRKSKFTPSSLTQFPWLAQRLHAKRRDWVNFKLRNGTAVRLRPSQMQHYGRGVALTWEVNVRLDRLNA